MGRRPIVSFMWLRVVLPGVSVVLCLTWLILLISVLKCARHMSKMSSVVLPLQSRDKAAILSGMVTSAINAAVRGGSDTLARALAADSFAVVLLLMGWCLSRCC